MTKANRKIGLGVMGWSDMLIQMNIPYNSGRAVELAEEVMRFIQAEGQKGVISAGGRKGSFRKLRRKHL